MNILFIVLPFCVHAFVNTKYMIFPKSITVRPAHQQKNIDSITNSTFNSTVSLRDIYDSYSRFINSNN